MRVAQGAMCDRCCCHFRQYQRAGHAHRSVRSASDRGISRLALTSNMLRGNMFRTPERRVSVYGPRGTTLPFTVTSTWSVFGLYSILPRSKVDTSRSVAWGIPGLPDLARGDIRVRASLVVLVGDYAALGLLNTRPLSRVPARRRPGRRLPRAGTRSFSWASFRAVTEGEPGHLSNQCAGSGRRYSANIGFEISGFG